MVTEDDDLTGRAGCPERGTHARDRGVVRDGGVTRGGGGGHGGRLLPAPDTPPGRRPALPGRRPAAPTHRGAARPPPGRRSVIASHTATRAGDGRRLRGRGSLDVRCGTAAIMLGRPDLGLPHGVRPVVDRAAARGDNASGSAPGLACSRWPPISP